MSATLRNLSLSPNIFSSFTLLLSISSLFLHSCYSSIDEQGQALLAWRDSLNTSTGVLNSWNPFRLQSMQMPLKSLKSLILSSTNLTGAIPKAFGDYLELTLIDLSDNSLSGEIPEEICRLRELQNLSLHTNFLEGAIPSDYRFFRAGGNKNLKGELPQEIGSCANLVVLGLAETSISGSLPSSIGKLKRIQTIAIYTALLSGAIPEEIGDCSELQNLYLYQNSISGPIPRRIGELSKLQSLLLWQNSIVGAIPDELGSCTELTVIDLSDNLLTGSIPRSFGKLLKLEELQLSVNQLTEQSNRHYPRVSFRNLTKLLILSNDLSGFIPPDIGNCTNLYRLRLNGNRLGGTIPSEIGNLKILNFIDLSNNLLVGGIPLSISGCQNLEFLDIHSNGITGSVPDSLPRSLQYVDVSDNRLTGSLAHRIGSLTELTKLNLAKNQLSGEIPAEILSCSKLQLLNLGDNGFSGEIPKELGQIPALEISLNLSCNQFSGKIPSHFSDLNKLGVLDISHNKLEGSLDVLANLQNLVFLNVSFNDFSGELPNTPFFRKLPLSDLASNQGLYIAGGVGTPGVHLGPGGHTRSAMKLLMSVLLSASAVLVLLAIYMLVRARIGSHGLMEDDTWEMTLYQKLEFSVDDIVKNLTSANVIGTGSSGVVYRVILPNGEMIAVKKMWSSEESGAFNSEIQTLGSIRHKNIVRLLGWCSNKNLKLLFYDYLPHGSLSSLLHGAGKGGAEWEARYDVLLDPTLPGGAHLVQWVREHLASKKDPVDILDSKLRGRADPTMHEMLQTLAVSFLCVSTRVDDRPMMKDVVAMLKEIRHVETVRGEPDLSKGVSLTVVRSSPPPARIVDSQGSSNCSFAFSEDSINY
ncbi:LEUCINE-RICH REPEAT RECEPTOR-LIKE PROTEIN KINASE FAMILY PROTEIN-RELATED [Salix koriyanagi]|uniref:non-specific serine/threonine protein kinase n=1 Tax=Salix koriyanagi TaxID=2511006 RepID=A0A9Q0X006_9ROSI|nr:LEUCINE-RICH REPEAT RECEPTOR-LIKE PROTEIN KINASE FAMILY PROTEIN-RELATED [Salix koriyanagi]